MVGGPQDIIEAEEPRGPRRWVGVAVLAVLVAVPVISLLASREPVRTAEPSPTLVPQPTATFARQEPNVLRPEVRRRGGEEFVDVVFPDGTRAEVGYPDKLGLAEMGVRPVQGAWLDGYIGVFRQLEAPYSGVAEVSEGRPMIRELNDRVTLWPAEGPAVGQTMLFEFGRWVMALRDNPRGMTFEQRMLWAENLRGKVTKDGYLVLSARHPVRLAGPGQAFRGEQSGPQLWFGSVRETLIVIAPIPDCDVGKIELAVIQRRGRFSAERCQNGFYVAVAGNPLLVQPIIEGVRVKPAK
ncbi:hypothetical protein HS041_31155 [Planomonospora sp. ID67723]|uniref:hypothetical protein n=1 Tax=Planomonospora sp. ID67723 TaxID=2738134 RepID=UPI0018C43270|nr:hypothetical protein [Planomonospora sp. ID67723]MBG0832166.1 hypothetical protein [Planomonospora sp. ID67723]